MGERQEKGVKGNKKGMRGIGKIKKGQDKNISRIPGRGKSKLGH